MNPRIMPRPWPYQMPPKIAYVPSRRKNAAAPSATRFFRRKNKYNSLCESASDDRFAIASSKESLRPFPFPLIPSANVLRASLPRSFRAPRLSAVRCASFLASLIVLPIAANGKSRRHATRPEVRNLLCLSRSIRTPHPTRNSAVFLCKYRLILLPSQARQSLAIDDITPLHFIFQTQHQPITQ